MRSVLVLMLMCLVASVVRAEVPPPSATPAKIIVSGHTSTAVDIKIVNVGQEIPKTYSRNLIKNTPGFSWWVSQHYALKTDYDKEMAEFYLTLLELAYPHYVELFGREPDGIEDTRMAVIYGSSPQQLKKAMLSDGIDWIFNGGGVTYEGIKAAYQFQCYDVKRVWDQPRYIVLHECVHQFQMCVAGTISTTPGWYSEGVANRLANHVYDSSKRQLTVNVFDKAGPLHFPKEGLAKLKSQPEMTLKDIIRRGWAGRGGGVVLCTFFNSTPDRMQKFRLWRDAMFQRQGKAAELMEKIFGPWEKLNAEFRAWIGSRKLTFSTPVGRQWSQDGDTLWAFHSPPGDRDKWSYMDVFLPPGEKPRPDPWRLDHPGEEMPSIVGPVKRGVPEPSVGCVVDLSNGPDKGRAGIGLGVIRTPPKPKGKEAAGAGPRPGYLKLLIDTGGSLVIEGKELGIAKKTLRLPDAVRKAMAAGGHRAGITARIAKDKLQVTVRARDPKASKDAGFTVSVPLTAPQRERILTRPLALLAQGGYHGVTHFFDPGRRPQPNLLVPAPANPWRNPGDKQLYGLYKAAWHLGGKTPASLLELRKLMTDAADKDASTQKKALAAYDKRLVQVVRDVQQCGGAPEPVQTAITDLTGLRLDLAVLAGRSPEELVISATVCGAAAHKTKGTLTLSSSLLPKAPEAQAITVAAGERSTVRHIARVGAALVPFRAGAQADLIWRGQKIGLRETRTGGTSVPVWWMIGPFDNPGGWKADVKHPVETAKLDLAAKYKGKGGADIAWRKVAQSNFATEHLVNYINLFGEKDNAAAYNLVWLDCEKEQDAVLAIGSDDGVIVWLNGKQVHKKLVGRGYSSKADRVPIHLARGRNKLLVKITQGGGGWNFCAHLESKAGGMLKNVSVSLVPDKE